MSSVSLLQPLSVQNLHGFQCLYWRDWPKYSEEFYCLKYIAALAKADPNIKHLKAYTLSDQRAQEQGLFLIVDRYQLFLGCQGYALNLLEQALHQLDWSKGMLCSSVSSRYIDTVLKVLHEKQLSIEYTMQTNLHQMPANQALSLHINCPEDFQLKPLTEQDSHLMDEEWPHRQAGSLYFFQRQIRHGLTMGLYEKDTQKLVAWCIRTQDGLLGSLQVRESHKRRGFGSLVVQALAQRIAAMGDDVTAEVHNENTASAKMFEKLGFQVIGQCHWVSVEPATGKFNWPEGQ